MMPCTIASDNLITVSSMASEWVGVIGTGIGAGIGGVVTVASLIVKGRQDALARREGADREDQLRADDRAWSVKERNVEERRALYADLLGAANNVVNGLGVLFASTLVAPDPKYGEFTDSMTPALIAEECTRFRVAGGGVSLAAVDQSLLRRVSAFDVASVEAIKTAREHPDQLLPTIEKLMKLKDELRVHCRSDLGLDGEDPQEATG